MSVSMGAERCKEAVRWEMEQRRLLGATLNRGGGRGGIEKGR